MVVAGMAGHSDIGKAHEIANEVRRVTKQLKEAQGLAGTYNNRERLFGMPVTNVSSCRHEDKKSHHLMENITTGVISFSSLGICAVVVAVVMVDVCLRNLQGYKRQVLATTYSAVVIKYCLHHTNVFFSTECLFGIFFKAYSKTF